MFGNDQKLMATFEFPSRDLSESDMVQGQSAAFPFSSKPAPLCPFSTNSVELQRAGSPLDTVNSDS